MTEQTHTAELPTIENQATTTIQVACPSADEVNVTYSPTVDRSGISDNAELVLREICSKACIRSATISSGVRSVESQAKAMYENAQKTGVPSQRTLYGHIADRVLDAYEQGVAQHKDAAQIQADMAEQINAAGPGNISHHISQGPAVSTFDVAPSSIVGDDAKKRFVREVLADARVQRFFQPPNDPGYHLEVTN
ncbi:hypothetical protein DyAD56_22850 [Dyella sp. AD56]|uniref:hypothetical protein n=1 Tax=Dyella sp. AD56 TaxID=1528744 RepID=UPI000CC5B5F4|nr:hypothetical protein [Dyella sp. AD56]PMQ02718.1 hypothetical protein DyAD56_22850 [Dyella sp. AD56]